MTGECLRLYTSRRSVDVEFADVEFADVEFADEFACCSGEGSHHSGNSDERNPAVLSRAVAVHPETSNVMYFA